MAFGDDMIKKKTPLQVLNKGPNYFRRNTSSQPQKQSISAVEQLFEGRGEQKHVTGGENQISLNVIHRLEYFNKNKKGLLDNNKTTLVQNDRRKPTQDDTSIFEATRRSRKLQEQKERMRRARSVERPRVESRLVITSFSSDESLDEGNDIAIDPDKGDSVSHIPTGRVHNRISFFSKTEKRVSNESSVIKYQDLQEVTSEKCSNTLNVSRYTSKPNHPDKPTKPPKPTIGYSMKACQGKENQKSSNVVTIMGTKSHNELKPGYHIEQKNNGHISNQNNNNSLEAVNQEKHAARRVIEAKPLLFHARIKSTSSHLANSLQQKDTESIDTGLTSTEVLKLKKLDIDGGIGNTLLNSAQNRLAKNEGNVIHAVSIDVPHSSVDKSSASKLSCAERLGVSVQPNKLTRDGERRIVASHSFHCFQSGGTEVDKRTDTCKLSTKPCQGSKGFVRRHVRQRSAPDAELNAWLKPGVSPKKIIDTPSTTTSKDDHSIQRLSQSPVHQLISHTPHLKTERQAPGIVKPCMQSNKSKPAIPEKPKKKIIIKKPLNEHVLHRIEHKKGFNSKKNNDVISIKSNDFQKQRNNVERTEIKHEDNYARNPSNKDVITKYTNTHHDSHSISRKESKDKSVTIQKENDVSICDTVKASVRPIVQQSQLQYKQYKPIKFQPRRKSSVLSTSTSICSETSKENLENDKQMTDDLRNETKLGHKQKASSVDILSDTQLKYHLGRSTTTDELWTAVKPIDHAGDGYSDDIVLKMLRSSKGNKLEGNELKSNQLNYVINSVETHQDKDDNEYQTHAPPETVNEYSLSLSSGANQVSSKSKSSMKPLTTGLRHKPYEYSIPLNTDWTGKSNKQYTSVAPPTRSQANPECLVERGDDWRVSTHEYSTANSKLTDRNLLVFDCVNEFSSVNQEGRIKQSTFVGQDRDSTAKVSRPISPTNQHQHRKSYSSPSQTEYRQDIKMDRFFRPVVKRVNSWNDQRRDKDSKELYKKALKENKQKLGQQCKRMSAQDIEKQVNRYTSPNGDTNVQLWNTKNFDKPTAKELLIIEAENVETYRKPVEGNNNRDVLKREHNVEEKVIDNSLSSSRKPHSCITNDNQNMQYNVQSEKRLAENELRTRQASVDEVHEALARLNSSKNSNSPSISTDKNSRHFSSPGVASRSIATSDMSREVSIPTSHKKNSPASAFVTDENHAELVSNEKIVEDTITSVLKHEEKSAMKVRRNSKALKTEKPQFLDLKIKEKPVVTDAGSNYNSLKRKQHLMRRNSWGSSSDISTPQISTPSRRNSLSELDTFFEQMGLDDNILVTTQSPHEQDNVFHTMYMEALNDDRLDADSDVMSEGSRVSESGLTKKLKKIPDNTSSIITRNAKVIKWLCQCKKAKTQL